MNKIPYNVKIILMIVLIIIFIILLSQLLKLIFTYKLSIAIYGQLK